MWIKTFQNDKGEYLKDIFIEDLADFYDTEPCLAIAGLWTTSDPKEAMRFRTSSEAITMKSLLRKIRGNWDYKNVEI